MSWSIGASQPDGMDIGASQTEAKFAPIITDQSPDTIVDELDLVSLFVTVIGVPAPTYQWYKDGDSLSGEINDTLNFTADIIDAGIYTCIVTNSEGHADSDPIVLTVQYAPIIIDQSSSNLVTIKSTVILFVTVIGVPAPTYQWKKDGSLLPGETNPTYTFTAGMSTMGVYTCTITNSQGYADTSDINIDLIGMLTYRMFNLQSDLDRT